MIKRTYNAEIKAWADGARIEVYSTSDNIWIEREYPSFNPEYKHRIKPDCTYAMNEIRKINSYQVEVYSYWLDGGELIDAKDGEVLHKASQDNDPFKWFALCLKDGCIFKKNKVKCVRWVCDKLYWDSNSYYLPYIDLDKLKLCVTEDDLLKSGYREYKDMAKQTWHKVPTYITEK